MDLLTTLIIGFSVVAAVLLFLAYAFFLNNLNKSPRAMITGGLLLAGLAYLQLGHLAFLAAGADPLTDALYRFWLFMTPSMFYLFSRSILFEETRLDGLMWVHVTPVLLLLVPQLEVSMALLFCIGTGYSFWLTQVIYSLRGSRIRSRFELFFLGLFSVMAIAVLVLGFSLPYMNPAYFYYAYAMGIGLAMVLVVGTLLSFPELLGDLAEAAKLRYANSTLKEVAVEQKKQHFTDLMTQEKLYQQEDLSLTSMADVLGLTGHQLSELVNTEFDSSFSRFVRGYRVRETERLLVDEPEASIRSISMEVGFKSQSNFYAAFKEITGRSPGSYRARRNSS